MRLLTCLRGERLRGVAAGRVKHDNSLQPPLLVVPTYRFDDICRAVEVSGSGVAPSTARDDTCLRGERLEPACENVEQHRHPIHTTPLRIA